ncbi:MAG: CBS domain-containing protein [Nibricoccus sp.]
MRLVARMVFVKTVRVLSSPKPMNTPIAVLLSRKISGVFSVAVTASVADAVRVMNLHKVGSVVVMQNGRLVGIFTERDVLTRVVASGRAPEFTSMVNVMTRDPLTVTTQATLEEVMAMFTDHRCRRLPVVDDTTGTLVGLISIGDVTRWMVDENRAEADHLKQYIAGGSDRAFPGGDIPRERLGRSWGRGRATGADHGPFRFAFP